jgi:aspartate 1-decarboxylase
LFILSVLPVLSFSREKPPKAPFVFASTFPAVASILAANATKNKRAGSRNAKFLEKLLGKDEKLPRFPVNVGRKPTFFRASGRSSSFVIAEKRYNKEKTVRALPPSGPFSARASPNIAPKTPEKFKIPKRGRPMRRTMLKSKIHRATLTECNLEYEGSIAIDSNLLKAADILPGELVHVLNVNNGSRLVTYAIEAPAGSGTVMLNGPAAREGYKGDVLVIITYAEYDEAELANHVPNVVKVDAQNRVK